MTAPTVEIRYAAERDVEAMLDLFELVAGERLWIGTEPGFDRRAKRARFLESIARPELTPIFVAEASESIVATLGVFEHESAGLTIGMLVHPAYRRRGIGRRLIERSFTWAREQGVGALSLHVFAHNEAARALYARAGFREIECYERDVTRQSGEVWDTILMRKEFA